MARKVGIFFRWLITLVILGAVGYAIWTYLINKPIEINEKPIAVVKVATPYRATVQQSLELTGYVEVNAMIPVVPFVSGTITGYYANAGDYVTEGQTLAQIDSKPYELQKQQAQAVYLAAEATFERVSNLYEAGAATKQNYDEAKAQLDAYKAQYELSEVQLGYATVTAPVSGTVLMANSAEGSVGVSTSPLYVLADLNKLQIKLNVPERYFDLINQNIDTIKAIVYRDGASTEAQVASVAPYISAESKTFQVTLELVGDVSKFRPGMYVSISMVYQTFENALVLDQKTRNTDCSAYYYDSQTQTAKYIMLEEIASDNYCFVIDEKYQDTLFIVDGQGTVLEGQRVNVI